MPSMFNPKPDKVPQAEPAPVKTAKDIQQEGEKVRADLNFNTQGFAANILTAGLGDPTMANTRRFKPIASDGF